MANLGNKSSGASNDLFFKKYVTDNPRFDEFEFRTENSKTPISIYHKSGDGLRELKNKIKPDTELEIIHKDYHEINGVLFAYVKIENTKGYIKLSDIHVPQESRGVKHEKEVAETINNFILSCGCPIDIKLKGSSKIYKNISYAFRVTTQLANKHNVKGNPKADLILCEKEDNTKTENTIYISLKLGTRADQFSQYGGITEKAGASIETNPKVKKFIEKVASFMESAHDRNNNSKLNFIAEFKDPKLTNLSIFGPEYGNNNSMNNVHMLAQGLPIIKKVNSYYELDFTGHTILPNQYISGDYTAVLGGTYRSSRNFTFNYKQYNNIRLGIFPKKYINGRSNLIKIEL